MAKLLNWLPQVLLAFFLFTGMRAFADVKSDFISSNSNNGWEYGFVDDNGNFTAYNTTFDDSQGIAGWCLNNAPGPEGDVTINYTDQPIDRYGVHWEPGQILAHAPLHGQGVVISWTAFDSVTASLNVKLIAQNPDTSPKVELWAGGSKLLDDKFTGTIDETCGISALSSEGSKDSVLEKSTTTSMNKGDKIKLIVKTCDKHLSSHIVTYLSVTATNAKGVALPKMSLGTDSSRQDAKLSFEPTNAAQEVTSK